MKKAQDEVLDLDAMQRMAMARVQADIDYHYLVASYHLREHVKRLRLQLGLTRRVAASPLLSHPYGLSR